jgi:predicted tellurium resistance membrane protein TerC
VKLFATLPAFVQKHPTIKMLALSFLILIGVTLIAEGLDQHIPKGYIYFAMAFSVLVEILNLRLRKVKTSRCTCITLMTTKTKPEHCRWNDLFANKFKPERIQRA